MLRFKIFIVLIMILVVTACAPVVLSQGSATRTPPPVPTMTRTPPPIPTATAAYHIYLPSVAKGAGKVAKHS